MKQAQSAIRGPQSAIDTDVLVIGGGTAGLVTASGCARLGRRVTLVERGALGGDCLWTGCVPTKALLATAKLIAAGRRASDFGLEPHSFPIDATAILGSMRERQAITAHHDDPEKFRRLGIDVIFGEARFVSPREVAIGERRLTARHIVVATGARTSIPPVDGLMEAGFLDHASFLRIDSFPRRVAIVGGGPIGVEFAQMLARFGSEVTVIEILDHILPLEDADSVRAVEEALKNEGVAICSAARVTRVRRDREGKVVSIEARDREAIELRVDEIFLATGRRGNIEGLGLEAAGVRTEKSYVVVDDRLRTTAAGVWACGDVTGGLQFTHLAAKEAVTLVRNMLFPGSSRVDRSNVPWAIFTDPEIARVGLTEEEARSREGEGVRVYRVEMADVDRAVAERATSGFVKIVCDRRGRILGAHLVCADASSLIAPIVLARAKGLRIGELARLVMPYPSLADAIQRAATQYYEEIGRGWAGGVARWVAGRGL